MSEMADIVPVQHAPLARETSMGEIMRNAVESGNVEMVRELKTIFIEKLDREAEQAFNDALVEFHKALPPIPKTRSATGNVKKEGTTFAYAYANLDDILCTVRPLMARCGLSLTYTTELIDRTLYRVAELRHVSGAKPRRSAHPIVADSGRMSAIQQTGSGDTYAKRYAAIAVLGLTTCDDDDDGAGAVPGDLSPLGAKRILDYQEACESLNIIMREWWKYHKVSSWEEFTVRDIPRIDQALNEARIKRGLKPWGGSDDRT